MTDYASLRRKMVDHQLRPNDITSHDILQLFDTVPRELFVPVSMRPFAYMDEDILTWEDEARTRSRHLLKPVSFARLVQAAAIRSTDLVLDIAVGSGYSTAILSALCESVVAIEAVPELVETAAANLLELGIDNAAVLEADVTQGYSKEGPYDVIVINGAVDFVPPVLFEQLKPDGRLLGFTGRGHSGQLTLFSKTSSGFASRPLMNAAVPALADFHKEPAFSF